jgi:hypothetical protein
MCIFYIYIRTPHYLIFLDSGEATSTLFTVRSCKALSRVPSPRFVPLCMGWIFFIWAEPMWAGSQFVREGSILFLEKKSTRITTVCLPQRNCPSSSPVPTIVQTATADLLLTNGYKAYRLPSFNRVETARLKLIAATSRLKSKPCCHLHAQALQPPRGVTSANSFRADT